MLRLLALGLSAALVLAASPPTEQPAAPAAAARERGYRENNRGVALLEQYRYADAAAAFRRALTVDPTLAIAQVNLAIALLYDGNADAGATAAKAAALLPASAHAHYVAGLSARATGDADEAIAAFKRVLEIDPADSGSRVNLGQLLSQQRDHAEAATLFREALAAEPFNATAAYGLATALTRSGAAEEGRAAMARFEVLRDAPYAITYAQTYLAQGQYGEALASTGAEPDLVDATPPAVTFVDATATALPPPPAGAGGDAGSVSLADVDGDGDLDAYIVTSQGLRLYLNRAPASPRPFEDVTRARKMDGLGAASPRAAIVGDYDNDRRADILLIDRDGYTLARQRPDGSFEDATARAGLPRTPTASTSGAFADIDHDGDLDIFIAGVERAHQLFRNNGDGTFAEIAAAAGVAAAASRGLAVAPTDFDNRRDMDLLVVSASGAPALFQNMRDGTFRDVAADVGLPRDGTYSALAAGDLNKDGYTDFVFGRRGAAGIVVVSDGRGKFAAGAADAPADLTAVQLVDYDNDGLLDLFAASGRALRLLRNVGGAWSDVSDRAGLPALAKTLEGDVHAIAFGDIDRDGDQDALALTTGGRLSFWRNQGGSRQRSLRVDLDGRVSNRFGVGTKIDMRAGSLRQRIETSATTPAVAPSDALFGLGRRAGADVVRALWPSGTLQAETAAVTRGMTIAELDRKPSSCPYLYVWDGSRFTFVTDFMGGGEIGYWSGPDAWNTPDPDEYVRIPPGLLTARDGRYDLRITNELEEALFVDSLQLVAIDHPAGVDLFPNEGLGAPAAAAPFTTTRDARPPSAARDEHGHDVLDRVRQIDRRYPDDFELVSIRGYAAPHALHLDLGPDASRTRLLATGWTDYAFSSDNRAAHQRGMTLAPPSLEALGLSGAWRPVLANIGIPVGRPQTVVVDLRGKLEPGEREVRIVTNMRIYWDQILVATSDSTPSLRVTRLDPREADLRWRGFSKEISPDGRQPFGYDYARVTRSSPWKTMIGSYTREGDVRPLLTRVDDLFAIARPGDEIALSFEAADLPPLGPGDRRTFLLYADGYSKEMDITSASPHTVGPLPFRAMRSYPYGPDQRYPSSDVHREYHERYNTRVIRRSLPPLEDGDRR